MTWAYEYRKTTALLLVLLAVMLASGCAQANRASNDNGVSPKAQGSAESNADAIKPASEEQPIELLIFKWGGVTLTNTEVENYFNVPIKAKFPHITVKLIDVPEGSDIEPLLTQGIVPDIIFGGNYQAIDEAGLAEPLASYKDRFGYDDDKLKQTVVEATELRSGGNQIPFSVNLPVIYYNKDIFDKFGVPYPDEAKTWDEILTIAKQLTRTEGGVPYIGIDLQPSRLASGLSLDVIDPATNRAAIGSPEWKQVFELLKQLYEIPGFIGADDHYRWTEKDDIFYADQNLAMYSHNLAQLVGPLEELRKQGVTLNWDFAPHPNFEEALGTSIEINVHSMTLSKAGKHKNEAYQVMNYMLSEEVQRIVTRNGRVSVLDIPELQLEYGADIEVLRDKTIANIFKAEPRKPHLPNIYEGKITKYLTEAAEGIALNGWDVNTAIRHAQEKIDKDLETLEKTKS
jgi:multiple sugar transport system substrate-binding protein